MRDALWLLDPDLVFYDGLDAAVIGVAVRFGMEPVVCYSLAKVREVLLLDHPATEDEDEREDAWQMVSEHIGANVLGTWAGDRTPVFVESIEDAINQG